MIGVDVCSVVRIESALAEHGDKFVARVLTPSEREAMGVVRADKLARRWAVKEAVAKALGTGIGGKVGFQDIEITHTPAGAPVVRVRGYEAHVFNVSVSDDAGVAVAMVMVQDSATKQEA